MDSKVRPWSSAVKSEFPFSLQLLSRCECVKVPSTVVHALAILTTAFRLFYRWHLTRFSWEDWWAALALICDMACLASVWMQNAPHTREFCPGYIRPMWVIKNQRDFQNFPFKLISMEIGSFRSPSRPSYGKHRGKDKLCANSYIIHSQVRQDKYSMLDLSDNKSYSQVTTHRVLHRHHVLDYGYRPLSPEN